MLASTFFAEIELDATSAGTDMMLAGEADTFDSDSLSDLSL